MIQKLCEENRGVRVAAAHTLKTSVLKIKRLCYNNCISGDVYGKSEVMALTKTTFKQGLSVRLLSEFGLQFITYPERSSSQSKYSSSKRKRHNSNDSNQVKKAKQL